MTTENIDEIIKSSLFDDVNIIQPTPLITIDGKTILTEGNFITLSGLPKSRKTTFMQFFIASGLTNKDQISISTNLLKNDKIILIDTEQSIYDFSKQNKFLKKIIGKNKLPNNIQSYLFRQYEPDVIMAAIEKICETEKPKLIFIDNLTELAINPNDIAEAKKIIMYLKKITQKYNIGIVCLLHLAKSNNFTLGNLGSYADRGSQSVLKVTLDKDSNISTLEPIMMRSDAHFDPISITFDVDLKMYVQTDIGSGSSEKKKKFSMDNYTMEDILSRVKIVFEMQENYTYAPLIEALKKIFGVGNSLTKQTIIPYLIYKKIIKQKEGNYTFNN